jgi:hypothetical protein
MITNFKLYESNKEIDSFFDKKAINKNPKFLYHLTSGENLMNVMKDGLSPNNSKSHRYVNGVYLTNNLYVALTYKYNKHDCHIIEIPFNNLNVKYMKPDDWEFFQQIDDDWEDLKNYFKYKCEKDTSFNNSTTTMGDELENIIWNTLNYKHSLFICEQMLYTKQITPDLFSNVYTESEANEICWDKYGKEIIF